MKAHSAQRHGSEKNKRLDRKKIWEIEISWIVSWVLFFFIPVEENVVGCNNRFSWKWFSKGLWVVHDCVVGYVLNCLLLSLAAPTTWWSGARSGWSSESSAFHSDWDRWGTLNLIFASSLVWCGEVLVLLESIPAVEREAGHNMMVYMWWQYV